MRKDYDEKDNIENVVSDSYDEKMMNLNDAADKLDDVSELEDGLESELKEWDFSEDEEIQEFLSRDFDVVAESRRRIQNNQNKARKGRQDRRTQKENVVKEKKEKVVKEKVVKEKVVKEKSDSDKPAFIDKVKELYSKWLEVYNKNSMQILFGALTGLIALLVVAIVATYPNDVETNEEKTQKTTLSTEEPTTELESETTTERPTIVPETEDSDIHSLIVGYIDAAYIKADMEAVALVVDDTTNINVDKYKSRQKYIELYENVSCYKLESAIENAYIVFVTYDAKLYNIETLAPSAETFIVKYDATNSKYVIHNLTVGEVIDSYIAGASKIELISEKRAEVESRLNAALTQDPELKKVYDIMISTGSQTSEEATVDSSSGETTSGNGAEETTSAAAQ